MQINNIYDLTPELYKDLFSTSYTGEKMRKHSAMLIMKNIRNDSGCTKFGDNSSSREKFRLIDLLTEVAEVENRNVNEEKSDFLERDGLKIVIPSNIFDIYTKLEILVGLKLSGPTNTLTKASNLTDELYNRGEIRNEQQYRKAPDEL